MPWPDDVFLTFANRWVHVFAMAFMLGGSAMLWGLAVSRRARQQPGFRPVFMVAAIRYEVLFWLAFGLLIVTGMGNAGAFAGHLPNPETVWGHRFVVKLFAVLLLLLISVARTMLVHRLDSTRGVDLSGSPWRNVQVVYAGTSVLAGIILTLALRLAHG